MQGILRGFDPFMNLVVDDCLEMGPGGQQNTIGMVVSVCPSVCVNCQALKAPALINLSPMSKCQ